MANQTLEQLIKEFSADGITRFFRERSQKFAPRKEALDEYNDDSFKGGIKLGEIKFDETEELIVCAFSCENSLSERSGKKAQYEKAKKVLKDRVSDAGIFVFYDPDGNFRFSLVYTNYLGKKKDWSTFKRFTYFVRKESTNKTFLQRIGNGDFSSLEIIQEAFSVEKVTKEFYENISYWYFWAVKKCVFPKDAEAEENGRNISVIRLITRIIFVWFMRERKLIGKELFDKDSINELLLDTSDDSSSYYQAILQNLFFATLSTKQAERQFRSEARGPKGFNPDHGNPYVFRFQEYLKDPKKLRNLFVDIPFLNGGLFDCLDDSEKGIYIDGFSETKKNQAVVPNVLFFGKETKVDLSSDLGKQQKRCPVQGLLNLLSEFNFTIDENTADDKDVALDPELLGRVFENLLASFNPETSTTARKATGSYYTPREIVDYMVDESLKGYLTTHLSDIEGIDGKLVKLFSQEIEENPFTVAESKRIVNLIESVRVVDPAVGSGAFPMGILNRLVFLLYKVDPDNSFWKQEQLNAAEQIPDPIIKQETRNRIEAYFEKNDNYGRKLFLIQKCIYGVDIQQIAVEIAKLRFFISLLVDENINKDKLNWGIEPLPNLDFKIMQGNSLISEFLGVSFEIEEKQETSQISIGFSDEKSKLIKQFENNKIEYQNASDKTVKGKIISQIDSSIIELFEYIVKQQKEYYFNSIEQIRKKYSVLPNINDRYAIIDKEIERINIRYSFNIESAEKQLSEYTGKNKIRPFFPWQLYFAEVFNEKGGFDIVITNPPYIGEKGHKESFREIKQANLGKYYLGKMDFFYFFFHLALDLGNSTALISFITTNYYTTAYGGTKLRSDFMMRAEIRKMINLNELKIFESALGQHNMITILQKGQNCNSIAKTCVTTRTGFSSPELLTKIVNWQDEKSRYYAILQKDIYDGGEYYIRLNGISSETNNDLNQLILAKIKEEGTPLVTLCNIKTGLDSAADYVSPTNIHKIINRRDINLGDGIFVLRKNHGADLQVINSLTKKEKLMLKPFYKNSDIYRYYSSKEPEKFIIYLNKESPDITEFPNIKNHLDRYKSILVDRREVINGNIRYFELHWPRNPELFSGEKLLVPYRSKRNIFGYSTDDWFCRTDCYIIKTKQKMIDIKYLLALLNSSLFLFWVLLKGKRKGQMIELLQKPLTEIPIKIIPKVDQIPFIEIINKILLLTGAACFPLDSSKQLLTIDLENQIDALVYKLYGLTTEEIEIVESTVNYVRRPDMDEGEDILDPCPE